MKNTYILDKEHLKNKILKGFELPLKICPSISVEKINFQINSLPEKIILIKKAQDDKLSRGISFGIDKNELLNALKGDENIEISHYKKMAEVMAPIFAREIVKELTKLIEHTIIESEKERKKIL